MIIFRILIIQDRRQFNKKIPRLVENNSKTSWAMENLTYLTTLWTTTIKKIMTPIQWLCQSSIRVFTNRILLRNRRYFMQKQLKISITYREATLNSREVAWDVTITMDIKITTIQ